MNRSLLIFLFAFLTGAYATTIQVPGDQSTIQAAIEAATSGDTVLVSNGVYTENINFLGKKLVVGSLFLTTGDTSYISQTIIDGNQDSSVVSMESFEPQGTELVGFSIRNGLGTGDWPNVRGGGVHIRGGQPNIRYCYIYDNQTTGNSNRGAGIMASTAYAYISNCRIYNNTSLSGAGIWIGNGASGTVVDSCAVYNNSGGGIFITYSSNVTISRTRVSGNSVWGLRNFATDSRFIHNTISNNKGYGFVNSTTGSGRQILEFVNTICYANTDSFDVANDTLIQARYSILEKASDRLWFGEGCLDENPQFTDTLSFAIVTTSPAVDAGDPQYPKDPDSTVADIGAFYFAQPTSISDQNAVPAGFALEQNYPNPFNPVTNLRFSIAEPGSVELNIYDILGRNIRTLVNREYLPGVHEVQWDGKNSSGQAVSSGVYFYRIHAGKFTALKKMMLVR